MNEIENLLQNNKEFFARWFEEVGGNDFYRDRSAPEMEAFIRIFAKGWLARESVSKFDPNFEEKLDPREGFDVDLDFREI